MVQHPRLSQAVTLPPPAFLYSPSVPYQFHSQGLQNDQCIAQLLTGHMLWYDETLMLFWAHGNVVGWGTMLQVGRSRVQFPVRSLDFSVDLILPVALWPWGQLSL
jgi:hypothetical protein